MAGAGSETAVGDGGEWASMGNRETALGYRNGTALGDGGAALGECDG